MSRRLPGSMLAGVGVSLVLAQFVAPAWAGFHDWPYAAALAIAATAALTSLRGASAGATLGFLGAAVTLAAGLASGLLGPDSETVSRAPGTVAPLPAAGVAAFFPDADPAAIARGEARVTLRRSNGPALVLGPGERRFLGATAFWTVPKLAAFLEARDARGRRVTITQPTNPAFLSPVALFPERVTVAGRLLPADTFATPALRRQLKVFYFAASTAAAAARHGSGAALLCVVDDDAGHPVPGGIGFVHPGVPVRIGGVRLAATLGTYPAVVISAIPYVPALAAGGLLMLAGIGLSRVPQRGM